MQWACLNAQLSALVHIGRLQIDRLCAFWLFILDILAFSIPAFSVAVRVLVASVLLRKLNASLETKKHGTDQPLTACHSEGSAVEAFAGRDRTDKDSKRRPNDHPKNNPLDVSRIVL